MRCGIGLTDTRKEGPPAPSTRSTARPAKIPRLVHVCRGCHVDLRAPRSSSCRAIPGDSHTQAGADLECLSGASVCCGNPIDGRGLRQCSACRRRGGPDNSLVSGDAEMDALSRAIPPALGRGCAPIDSRRQAVMLIGSSRSRTSRSARSRMSPPLACGFGWSAGGKAETAGGAFENARRRAGTAGRI